MSSGAGIPAQPGIEPAAPGARVTSLELFYDLVFVFAFFTVAELAAQDLTPTTLVASFLVLTLLWFSWVTFAALGNVIRADHGIMPLVGFATMAAIFVMSVTMPDAFEDDSPGLPAELVFAVCYLVVRGFQVLTAWYAIRADPKLRHHWRLLALPVLVSTALLLVAAVVPQRVADGSGEFVVRVGFWVIAIAIEYSVAALFPVVRLTIVSASHYAERYAQIVLVALGEAIISLGTGSGLRSGLPLTWSVIGACGLGIALIAALWWAYFDFLGVAAERALHRTQGTARIALARDAYSYLHLPMIIGIILFALGLHRVLAEIAEPTRPEGALRPIELHVLYGGLILYTVAHLGFQLRTLRRTSPFHIVAVLSLAALIPVARGLPALGALALSAAVVVGLLALQHIFVGRFRREVRRAELAERQALETAATRWRHRYLRSPSE